MAKLDFWKTTLGQGDKIPWPTPRLTTVERNQVQTQPGLTIFNTDVSLIQVFNGFEWVSLISEAVITKWTQVSQNFTGIPGYNYIVDTTASAISMTLPPNPNIGAVINLADGGGAFASHNLTVIQNGRLILGANENLIIDEPMTGGLLFAGGSQGWVVLF